MQKLILPINHCKLTASMKTQAYRSKYGFEHYGVDMVSATGDRKIYASGSGIVVAVGYDSVVGNVVAVHYGSAWNAVTGQVKDVVFRYYHLEKAAVRMGTRTTKDTVLGYYGNTGQVKMANHLHLEADADTAYPLYSPTVLRSSLLKGRALGANDGTMSTPLDWLHKKVSAPDNQTYTTAADAYVRQTDQALRSVS